MKFSEVKDQMIVGCAAAAVTFIGWMAISVHALAIDVAVVVSQVHDHQTRIEKLEGK